MCVSACARVSACAHVSVYAVACPRLTVYLPGAALLDLGSVSVIREEEPKYSCGSSYGLSLVEIYWYVHNGIFLLLSN